VSARPTSRRRILLISAGGVGLILLLIAGFLVLFEPVEVTVRVGPDSVVRANPLLAAQWLFEYRGETVRLRRGLGHMPDFRDFLVIYLEEGEDLRADEAARLRTWLETGGHALAGPYPALLEMVGARLEDTGEPGTHTLTLEGGKSHHYRISAGSTRRLVDVEGRAAFQSGDDGTLLLRYEFGTPETGYGHLTLLPDLSFATNDHIGEEQHAALLDAVVNVPMPTREVWLVRQGVPPAFLAVVVERAWMVLLSLAVLIAAWLLRGSRPFGPPLPVPEPGRRSLREHLVASGQFLWRQGRADTLVTSAREAALARVVAHQPGWERLPFRRRCEQLAERTGLTAETVARALEGPAPTEPADFVRTLETLETLRRFA